MIKINGKELDRSFTFSGGERQIRLPELGLNLSDPDNRGIVVDCKLKSSDDIMDMLLVDNALWCSYQGFFLTTFNIWYLPYARQDRACYPGEAVSTQVMESLLGTMIADVINVADVHSRQSFEIPVDVKETTVLDIFKTNPEVLDGITALVSPDAGASDKVSSIGEHFNIPVIYCEKVRDTESGWITDYKIKKGMHYISGGNLLVIDDICDGGMTFNLLGQSLIQGEGKPTTLELYVTHGIFSKGIEVLYPYYDKIITTDSRFVKYDEVKTDDYDRVKVIKL